MSDIVNKVKEALHPDKTHETTHSTTHNTSGAPEGTYGPHSSRVSNAADPRVDSDRDNRGAAGVQRTAGHGEYGSSDGGYMHGTGPTHAAHDTDLSASTGSAGFGHSSGTREGQAGPHGSRIANAVDPRVDSDRDGSRNAGAAYNTGTAGNTLGSSGYAGNQGVGAGTTGYTTGYTTGTTAGTREGEYGPHGSRTANALDPRVDSDRDASRNAGAAYNTAPGTAAGSTFGAGNNMGGTGYTSATTGANNATGLGQSGPGPAPNTAGPHKSDMINKLDPRVDSDLDGSKTAGGNKTYQ